jgi:Domain of unknown function (DUF5666)
MEPNEPSPDLPTMTPGPSAEPPKPSARKQWIAAAVGGVIVIAGALIGMQLMKSDSSGSATPTESNTSASGAADTTQRPAGMPGTRGTITSIDGATLTVENDDGDTVTVTTDDDTTVTKTEEGAVADIAVGDNLLVTGATSGSQTAAERIVDNGTEELGGGFRGGGPPGDGDFPDGGQLPNGGQLPERGELPDGGQLPDGGSFTPPVMGSVTSIDNGTITLETSEGETVTVTTSSSTEVSVRHSIEVGDLEEGDTVVAIGETSGNEVAATTISVGDAGGFGPGGGFGGPGGGFPGAPPDGSGGNGAGERTT